MKIIKLLQNFIPLIVIIALVCSPGAAIGDLSAPVFMPDITVKIGQPVILPVNINKVEKLAGIKLVIGYDANFLGYVESKKTDVSKSFMHVVNDKKPGELIVVMASAKGLTAEKATILNIAFSLKNTIDKKVTSIIRVSEGELMDENLKKIEFNPFEAKVTIIP
jgi:hypothetical protein